MTLIQMSACSRETTAVGADEKRRVFITGVAETPLGKGSDHPELSMVAIDVQQALAEAGLTRKDGVPPFWWTS